MIPDYFDALCCCGHVGDEHEGPSGPCLVDECECCCFDIDEEATEEATNG